MFSVIRQPPTRGPALPVTPFAVYCSPQGEGAAGQKSPGHQNGRRKGAPSVLQTDSVIHLGFGQLLAFTEVNQQPLLFNRLPDGEFFFCLSTDFVTDSEAQALQRRLVDGVKAGFAGGLKLHLHTAVFKRHDGAQRHV